MVIETLVTKGVGWRDVGKWFWDVYVADTSGQPSLYSGMSYDRASAERICEYCYQVIKENEE